jgi:putative transposase
MDLRERVLADCDAGQTTKPVAEKYGVSRTWVRSLKQRRRETGEIAPRKGGGRKRKIDRARLAELVREDPDATLAELRERLAIRCALSAIWTVLRELKVTFKKSRCGRRSRTVPTSRNAARPGSSVSTDLTRSGSSSSTKHGPRPT